MKNKNIYPWVVVALLWVVALLNYMDRQMLSTMQEAMKIDIVELTKAEAFGALMAVFLWIYGFMSPVAGIIADRLSRKWLIVGSLFVWSAVTFLMGYATTLEQLYGLRAVMGISEALYIPSALSLIADWHPGQITLIGNWSSHDRTVCRSGNRWVWSYGSRCIFLAEHFSLVWHCRYCLFCGSYLFPA